MTLEQTQHDGEPEERSPVDLFPNLPIGSDFEHDGDFYVVEADGEGGKRIRNLVTNNRISLQELFENDQEVNKAEVHATIKAETGAHAEEGVEAAVSEAAGEAVATIALIEAEARGKSHEAAVHEIAMKAEQMLEKTHEELEGIPSSVSGQKHELPGTASEMAQVVETESFGEISVADRKEVIDRVFSVNRELRMIDGEIRKLRNEGASDADIRNLSKNAAMVRRDIFKLIKAGSPSVYARFAEKYPEMVGTSKERAMVLQEFVSTYRERGENQRKADAIFEQATSDVVVTNSESQPVAEMQAVENRIDATVLAEVGPETVSDKALVEEFKKEGIIPPDNSPGIEAAPEYNADTREAIRARALSMQEEMDSLASGDHHQHWEMGGSLPHNTEDLNFGHAIAPNAISSFGPASSYTVSGYAPSRVTYRGVEVSNEMSDWSSFATRGAQYRSVSTHIPSSSWGSQRVGENPGSMGRKIEAGPTAVTTPKIEAAVAPIQSSVTSGPRTMAEKLAVAAEVASARSRESRVEKAQEVSPDVYERFGSTLGLSREVLDRDPSFSKLTHEQQLLVLRDVASFSVDNINQETKKSLEREWDGQGKMSHVAETAKKFISFGLLGSKGALTAKRMREDIATSASMGEGKSAKAREIFLRDIARVRLEQNPSISIETDGSLRVNVVSLERARTPEDRELLERYNQAAAAWSRIPERVRRIGAADMNAPAATGITARFFDRRVAGLSSVEQVQYESARTEWEEAEGAFSSYLMREPSDIVDPRSKERAVSQELISHRDRIAMGQYFNGHSNAEAALLSMENPPTWSEALSAMLRAAPAHMAYGAITRAGAVAALTALGAPAAAVVAPLVAAAGISGLIARKQEMAKARTMLKERRASGAMGEDDLREKDVVVIDYARNLKRKQDELREAVLLQDQSEITRLQKDVAEQEARVAEHGSKVRVSRELREFRDAKHFASRLERLLSSHENASELADTGDADASKRMQLLESKIAKTAALMRAYKNEGMINYKRGYTDTSHAQGYADFAEALTKAEIAVSVDGEALENDIYEKLVSGRRERLDAATEKRMSKEVRNGVLLRMGYAVAGSLISMEFFRGGIEHVANGGGAHVEHVPKTNADAVAERMSREIMEEMKKEGAIKPAVESNVPEVGLPREITDANALVDKKAAYEWEHAGIAERAQIEKVTGKDADALASIYGAAEALGEYKMVNGKLNILPPSDITLGSESAPVSHGTHAAPYESPKTATPEHIAPEHTPTKPGIIHGSAHHALRATPRTPLTIESSHGEHIVASGETLTSVMRNMSEMKNLSPDAREIAIADFVKFATPEQLKAVGITNVNTLAEGQSIDVEKLGEALRNTTYRGTPLLEHAARLADGNPTEAHVAGAHGWTKPDESAFEKLIHRVAGSNDPVSHASVVKDEAAFDALIEKVSSAGSEVARVVKLSPEMATKVHESVENVFSVFPDKGEHLRGMRAEDVLHKSSPYRWSSVSMNSEYNAMQTWMRDVVTKTHIEPKQSETVEQYLSDVYEKIHAVNATPKEVPEATKGMLAADFAAENATAKVTAEVYGKAGENLGFETAYVDQNHNIFQHKPVESFLKEEPGHIRASGVNAKDYFLLQGRLITLTSNNPSLPKETVYNYMHRITKK